MKEVLLSVRRNISARILTRQTASEKNIRIEDGGLRLPKINGLIELSMHRPIKPGGTLKSVTVTHEPDGKWYFLILIEYPAEEVELSDGLQKFFASSDINAISGIGLDMSVPFLYIDSSGNKPSYELNGKEIKFMKQYRKLEKRIAKEQRRRSHMVLKILIITTSRARKSPDCMRKPSIAGKIFFIRLL